MTRAPDTRAESPKSAGVAAVSAAPRPPHSRRLRSAVYAYGGSLVLIAAIGALWQFAVPLSMSSSLPRPSVIVAALVADWPVFWRNATHTGLEAIIGFVIGTIAGVLIAAGFIYSRRVARTVYPAAVLLRSLPLMALMPFLVSLFGTGIASKVVLVALTCFFPTLVNVVQGLTSIDEQALELMRTLDASERQIFWKLRVPCALPHLFTSFRITSSAAVLGAIIAEWMYANKGLGAFIVTAMFNMRGNQLWAAMILATAMSVLAYLIAVIAERIVVPWRTALSVDEVEQ